MRDARWYDPATEVAISSGLHPSLGRAACSAHSHRSSRGAAAPMRGSVSNGAGEKRAQVGAATGAASLPLASCAPAYSIDWPRLRKMRVTGRASPRRSHSFAALTLRGGVAATAVPAMAVPMPVTVATPALNRLPQTATH